ncbi:glycosyltransferase [Parafrankia sp. FMc2]|uniref:glycosyltransferase n=1 Tax=Parafrankia sp. FMc2 TaxID=3233196 RepID=UPI0034D769F5
MRLLFSVTPAFGHLLPMVPLARAAMARGHQVGILTSAGMADILARELPGAEHLPAGTMPAEFAAEAARRTGEDVMQPTPAAIGVIFGGVRLETASGAARRVAAGWKPEIVVAEAFDTVGPAVATELGVPWHQAGLGPALPAPITASIAGAAAGWYREHDLRPMPPRTYIDPCPPVMQEPGWHSPVRRVPVRSEPHATPGSAWTPPARIPGRPRVLVTLGTVFSDQAVLEEAVRAVASTGATVIATVGMALREAPGSARAPASDTGSVRSTGSVHFVRFAPMERLMADVDLVISAGGSGTVLAAMSRGVPMVLWPQGADQPINAARARAAGVAAVVGHGAELPGAVISALADENLRSAAASAARQVAALPSADEALTEIVNLSTV